MRVKICGISTGRDLQAATDAGATYFGLVFYPASPRALTPAAAAELARRKPAGVAAVGLFVDPDDATLDQVLQEVPLDFIQLHGDEPPARIAAIRERYALPVIKAVRVRETEDLSTLDAAEAVADQVLCDAAPAAGETAPLPGGNGLSFDWHILAGRQWRKPWLLAGGLTPENVAEAIRLTGAEQVDVSSGVEDSPGHKSPELITAFLHAAGATPRAPTDQTS